MDWFDWLVVVALALVILVVAVDVYAIPREGGGNRFWHGYLDGRRALWRRITGRDR